MIEPRLHLREFQERFFNSRWLDRIALLICILCAIFVVWWTLLQQNLYHVDQLGHLASGVAMYRGLYHQFNDAFFLGGIHGLFYPPLEDVILSILGLLSFERWEWVFRIYIAGVGCAFLASIFGLIFQVGQSWARFVGVCLVTVLLLINKEGLTQYQGLSFLDLFVTGLSSQFLGALFLFRLCAQLLGKAHPSWIAFWGALCILSHLVVGLVAVGVFVLWMIFVASSQARRASWGPVIVAMAATSFFWLPFLVFRGELVPAQVVQPDSWVIASLGLFLGLLAWNQKKLRALVVLLVIFLSLSGLLRQFEELRAHFPDFHFSRLTIFGLYFAAIVVVQLIAVSPRFSKVWLGANVAALSLMVSLVVDQGVINWISSSYGGTTQIQRLDAIKLSDPVRPQEYGRSLVWGPRRSIDFALDSLLWVDNPDQLFTKGLFWESSKSNLAVNSMFATLWGLPVVLRYFYYYGYSCKQRQCFLDHFISQMNVKELIWPLRPSSHYLRAEVQSCYRTIVSSGGTSQFEFRPLAQFVLDGEPWAKFEVLKRDQGVLSSSVVERVKIEDVRRLSDREWPHKSWLRSIDAQCSGGSVDQSAWVEVEDYKAIQKTAARRGQNDSKLAQEQSGLAAQPSFKKIRSGLYEIDVGQVPTFFRIKLAPLPGLKLTDAEGRVMPLWSGFPHILSFGAGKVTLRYERPRVLGVSYLISLLGVVVALCLFLSRLRREGV